MPLTFVLDEHLRGPLWDIISRHNIRAVDPIDVVRVGGVSGLPLAIKDPDILLWAEREGRILISEDTSTMPSHLAEHLASGHSSPGVMVPRRGFALTKVLQFLVIASYASEAEEWESHIWFIP